MNLLGIFFVLCSVFIYISSNLKGNELKGVSTIYYDDDWCEVISKTKASSFYPEKKCCYYFENDYSQYWLEGNTIHVKVVCKDGSCTGGCSEFTFSRDQCYNKAKLMYKYGSLNKTEEQQHYLYTYLGQNCVSDKLQFVVMEQPKCLKESPYHYYYSCDGEKLQKWFFNSTDCSDEPVHKQDEVPSCASAPQLPTSYLMSCEVLV